MKPRSEYEQILNNTFGTPGDSKATRIQIDLLLDIRELLMWFKDMEMLEQAIEERKQAEADRVKLFFYGRNDAFQKQSSKVLHVRKASRDSEEVGEEVRD